MIAGKMWSSVEQTSIAVDCNVDFVCECRLNGYISILVQCEDTGFSLFNVSWLFRVERSRGLNILLADDLNR